MVAGQTFGTGRGPNDDDSSRLALAVAAEGPTPSQSVGAAALGELRRVLDVAPGVRMGFVLTGSKEVRGHYGAVVAEVAASQHRGSDIDAESKAERSAMINRNRS